jgi:hypothetical protein
MYRSKLTIVSEQIAANSGFCGSGIGSGDASWGNSIVRILMIVSGNISASSSSFGSGGVITANGILAQIGPWLSAAMRG